MLERDYQAKLIKRIKAEFDGAFVLKNDPNYIQGFPDLLVLFKDRWCALEVKNSSRARHQPNQDYYVDHLDGLGYARFIFPENEDEIIKDLHIYFS